MHLYIIQFCVHLSLLFQCRRALNKGVLLYIHINFVISLSLALAVFVIGIESATGYNVSTIAKLEEVFITEELSYYSGCVQW